MANMVNLNGTDYRVKRHRAHGRYVEVKIEDVTPGMVLDQGTFAVRQLHIFRNRVNVRTWNIRLAGGMAYTETRGAFVRVWM